MEYKFEHSTFGKRLKSMLTVDFRRMFTTSLFYTLAGVCFVMPILILVMTTMVSGSSIDPVTGEKIVADTFTNVWQAIGSVSGSGMSMGLTGMCNINMLYFFVAILVCLFVSDDFKSGYAKNLFAVRPKKSDYVISKSLVCFAGGAGMLSAFFVGTIVGGAIAGLPFDMGAAGISGIVMCMLSKLFLMEVFVAIYFAMSVAAKQKTWLAVVGSLCVGMLLFMMVPMMTPLDATILNVLLCLAGGVVFGIGFGAVSNLILRHTLA